MKKLKNRKNSGETLVEIIVSAMLFLIMMAVMQGAISFCTNAQQKSREIRASNGEICNKARSETGLTVEFSSDCDLAFKAVSADGGSEGNQVFTVETKIDTVKISDNAGKNAVFYLFNKGGGPP